MNIMRTVIRRARVGRVGREVLGQPSRGNLIPVHLQERTVPVVVLCGIGALLLMVHANGVADLMDHAAKIAHRVAPAKVDSRGAIAHAAQVAAPCAVDADHDVWARGLRRLLHEVDARLVLPLCHGRTEACLTAVVDVALVSVIDEHVLLPHVLSACWWKRGAVPPGATAWAAIAGPARPSKAGSESFLPRPLLLQQAFLLSLRHAVLFYALADLLASDNTVDVLEVALLDIPVLTWHAVVLVVAGVAVDLQRAARRGRLQHAWVEEQVGPWSLLMPNLLVQRGGTAAAELASLHAKDVHALAKAEGGALVRVHALAGERVEGEATPAGLGLAPGHARHVQEVVRAVRVGLLEVEAAHLRVAAAVRPGARVPSWASAAFRWRHASLGAAAHAWHGGGGLGARARGAGLRVVDRAADHGAELLGAAVRHAVPKGARGPRGRSARVILELHLLVRLLRARLQKAAGAHPLPLLVRGALLLVGPSSRRDRREDEDRRADPGTPGSHGTARSSML
mmetsp:Transcript_83985/g.246297  ORF Transcript_83985/g.246297 Transcript_83985/m.246297 type:complete len:511 (+) Transcript_83985:1133-2665(+)